MRQRVLLASFLLVAVCVDAHSWHDLTPLNHERAVRAARMFPHRHEADLSAAGEVAVPPVVGEHRNFWVANLATFPDFDPMTDKELRDCEMVRDSSNAYLFVGELAGAALEEYKLLIGEAGVQAIYDSLVAAFGGTISPTCTSAFGPVPDAIDGDPKVYLLICDPMNEGVGGYFDDASQYTDAEAMAAGLGHSNEVEMVHINYLYPPYDYLVGTAIGNAILAHEFQHLIHWGGDPDEELWINEGMSNHASIICGYPDAAWDHVYLGFLPDPDEDLLHWGNAYPDYGAASLFAAYFYDQFGGATATLALVQDSTNGTASVEETIAEMGFPQAGFRRVFGDWAVATYLDDPSVADGRYGYESYDIDLFCDLLGICGPELTVSHDSYPIDESGQLWANAADYIRLGAQPGDYVLECDGPPGFSGRAVFVGAGVAVTEVATTPDGHGYLAIRDFETLTEVVFIPYYLNASHTRIDYSYAVYPGTPVPTLTPTPGAKGDMDQDGDFDLFDVLRLVDIILERPPTPTPYEQWAGDLDDDGDIDLFDVLALVDLVLNG